MNFIRFIFWIATIHIYFMTVCRPDHQPEKFTCSWRFQHSHLTILAAQPLNHGFDYSPPVSLEESDIHAFTRLVNPLSSTSMELPLTDEIYGFYLYFLLFNIIFLLVLVNWS